MGKPHLCFVGWGDHVHLERWAGYFARNGYRVSVISFSGPGNYPEGVRQYSVDLKGRGPRWVELKLRYLLLRVRPDIVHVHWAHFAPLVRTAWSGPMIVTAWGSDIYRRDQFSDRQWLDLRGALHAADLVTCDSDDLAAAIRDTLGVANNRMAVIQWGVDTELFSPTGDSLRDELGVAGREVVFSARNFTPIYNQETVVTAFALLRERRPRAFLLMKSYGGDPAYLASIRTRIDALGLHDDCRIIESIPYEQMPALYRTADVTLSIPLSDATPMALLEAMSTQSLPVVSDLPSLREWIDDGVNGFLVAARDAGAVAAALERALDDPAGSPRRRACRDLVVARASQKAHMAVAGAHYDRLTGVGA